MFEAQCIEEGKRRIWIRQYQYIIDSPCSPPPPPPHTHRTSIEKGDLSGEGKGGRGGGGGFTYQALSFKIHTSVCWGGGG